MLMKTATTDMMFDFPTSLMVGKCMVNVMLDPVNADTKKPSMKRRL